MNVNVNLWAWACEQDEIFLSFFIMWKEYVKNIPCHIRQNLCWCGKIFYHMFPNGWKIYEFFGWKLLFVEEVWTTKVNEQGFKGISIHFKSIIPQWAIISFPFFNCNKWCFKLLKIFFVTMHLWQVPTNQKERMILISIWCSPYVNWNVFHNILLKPKYFVHNYFA